MGVFVSLRVKKIPLLFPFLIDPVGGGGGDGGGGGGATFIEEKLPYHLLNMLTLL